MEDNNSENNEKIPTNMVTKEERFLRMLLAYLRIDSTKIQSKDSLVKIILKDQNSNNEDIEKLKKDWVTIYYNLYDYFISKHDYIYTYFFNSLIYLCNEEKDTNKQLTNIIIEIMKICLQIYPAPREDVINFYQLFRLKDLNEKKFAMLMQIFNIIYSKNNFFDSYDDKKCFLFDGNSHIEIQLDKNWINSAYKENPNRSQSKAYYVLGFSIRYFHKNNNSKLAQIRFPSNLYLMLSLKNGFLHSNLPFKNDIQIPILENKDYTFTLAFLNDKVQIYVNENLVEISSSIEETAKNLIIGDKFCGLFYNIYSTFTLEPLTLTNGKANYFHPDKDSGGVFHTFTVNHENIYESIDYPKKIFYLKKNTHVNVTFIGRVLFYDMEKSYIKCLKRYGSFGTMTILLMFFIYKPEFYKKEYIKLIFDKMYENCVFKENEKLFSNSIFLVQSCIILCNFPKENRDLEIVDYISPLIKYNADFNYYLDILKLVYGYQPEKNKQPFSFHLIEVMIKKIIQIKNMNQLKEIKDILLTTLQHYNLGIINQEKENVAEDIYNLIITYFENYKSENDNVYFYVPNYFWFITLYIFFFELKDKIKEVKDIYNKLKEKLNSNNNNIINTDDNSKIVNILNYYILLSNKEIINFSFNPENDKENNYYLYITYIFKLYSRFKKNIAFEKLINENLKKIHNILTDYKFTDIGEYKNEKIFYFLIPCVYNLPLMSKSFKKDESCLILHLIVEDLFLKEESFSIIALLKNIIFNLKYIITNTNINSNSNGHLIYHIKNEIFKRIKKKYDFKVPDSFYSVFTDDENKVKDLSINISDLFGDLYTKIKNKTYDFFSDMYNISETQLKDYLDPSDDLYQNENFISNYNLEEIIANTTCRKNWIKTNLDEQCFYNQNWTDLDFCYNPDNKNSKFIIKGTSTNDLKYPFLYRIPDITKTIKHRRKKGEPDDKLTDLFNDIPVEPFPVCIHLSMKEVRNKLDFIFKYHEDLNLQVEKEYLTDNKKKYPCCVIGGVMGKGFMYIKDENTFEYQNYYELDKAEHYNYIDILNTISVDKKFFYNPDKVYRITVDKETIKMFFKKVNYYEDQGLEIHLFSGSIWNFTFNGKRDEFLEEAGLIPNDKDKKKDKEKEKNNDSLKIYDSQWKKKYLFKPIYNDLNYKSGLFSKTKINEIIGYASKYYRFPGENKYWENPCLSDILARWKDHKISTYTLLMFFNIFSGRSIEDKTQNPILPFLILLNNENKLVLRNLKLPICQQKLENNEDNKKKMDHFKNLYKKEKDKKKAYYYPCSVSSLKTSFKNLSSIIPYNQVAKSIFNDNNNILTSINKDINDILTNINVISESPAEFFYLSESLSNMNNLKDLKPEGVEVPSCDNYINNNNYNFSKNVVFTLALNKILESKEVNDTIGNWIDLIFGEDQRSEKLKNIYKPECYLNDKNQLKAFRNNQDIIKNYPIVGTLPLQLIKSTKFNNLISRKYIPLNLNFPLFESNTVRLNDIDSTEMLNFTAVNSEKYVFFGESKIWNINAKNLTENQTFYSRSIYNETGVIKELYNPKTFKRIFAISRLYNYSVHAGSIDAIITFYNHRKFDSAYNYSSKNKKFITAVELIDYVGYEHYLLVGKQNGHIHHYKVDFEEIDNFIDYPNDTQYNSFYYKSIFRAHSREIISLKYNCNLNLWISTSKDGYAHIWNYMGDIIFSVFIKSKNIKYALLSSDPIPNFIIYFDNEIDCYLLNQIKPIRKLKFKTDIYNFDIIKSNCFEDFLVCQDDDKIYIISLPYLDIVHEINEKVTSFDYLSEEKLIIGFLRNNNENKVTIKKIKYNI